MKHIIRKILRESLDDRLYSAYSKWCNKSEQDKWFNSVNYGKLNNLEGYEDDELLPLGDNVLKNIKDNCGKRYDDWFTYRNQMRSADIYQYSDLDDLDDELEKGKEKSFTKKLKKSKEGKDFEKIYEDEDMVIIVPLTHVGACKYGQGTRWCTASKVKPEHFEGYDEEGNLYRVLQKNDKLVKNHDILKLTDSANHKDSHPKHMNKVSIHLKYTGEKSMVDSIDNYYGEIDVGYFLAELPDNAVNAIKQYQSEN